VNKASRHVSWSGRVRRILSGKNGRRCHGRACTGVPRRSQAGSASIATRSHRRRSHPLHGVSIGGAGSCLPDRFQITKQTNSLKKNSPLIQPYSLFNDDDQRDAIPTSNHHSAFWFLWMKHWLGFMKIDLIHIYQFVHQNACSSEIHWKFIGFWQSI